MAYRMGHWGALALLAALLSGGIRAAAQAPQTLALAPEFPAAPAVSQARGVFFTRSQPLALVSPRITISSTMDGRGQLCTDDQVTLTIAQEQRQIWSWRHAFNSADHQTITCIAPVTFDLPLPAGSYSVTIVLEDLYPTTFSSAPYFLLPATGVSPALVASAATPAPTRQAAPTPAAVTQATAAPALPTASAGEASQAGAPSGSSFGRLLVGMIAGALLLMLSAWLLLQRRAQPRSPSWQGIVDLFDPATRESRTFTLGSRSGELTIQRQPLRLEAAADSPPGSGLATIRAEQRGPQLLSEGEPVSIEHGQSYQLRGGIQLRYRDLRVRRPGTARSRSA